MTIQFSQLDKDGKIFLKVFFGANSGTAIIRAGASENLVFNGFTKNFLGHGDTEKYKCNAARLCYYWNKHSLAKRCYFFTILPFESAILWGNNCSRGCPYFLSSPMEGLDR